MSTQSDSLLFLIAQLRSLNLNPFLNVAPQNTIGLNITYPIVVVTLNNSSSNYTVNHGEYRFEEFYYNIAVFDNHSDPSRIFTTINTIQSALEGQYNVDVNTSNLISTFLTSSSGPLWLNKEHYWASYLGYELIVGNATSGTSPVVVGGKYIISGSVAIPMGVDQVTIPAFTFSPTSLLVTIDKPNANDFNLFGTVRADTLAIGPYIVELNGTTDKLGYTINYIGMN